MPTIDTDMDSSMFAACKTSVQVFAAQMSKQQVADLISLLANVLVAEAAPPSSAASVCADATTQYPEVFNLGEGSEVGENNSDENDDEGEDSDVEISEVSGEVVARQPTSNWRSQQITCPDCNSLTRRDCLARHKRSAYCQRVAAERQAA